MKTSINTARLSTATLNGPSVILIRVRLKDVLLRAVEMRIQKLKAMLRPEIVLPVFVFGIVTMSESPIDRATLNRIRPTKRHTYSN